MSGTTLPVQEYPLKRKRQTFPTFSSEISACILSLECVEGVENRELKSRGVQDILVVAVDNLTGFSEAIAHVFPRSDTHVLPGHCLG